MISLPPVQCLNCGWQISRHYCSNCGQKTAFKRITFGYLWHEIFHFFTHIEKGFLFTTKQLMVDPGKVCIDYIEGRRKEYQCPVSYFLIWTSIFILTLFLFVKIFGEHSVIEYGDYFGPGVTTNIAISNLSFMLAFIIPIQAIYLYFIVMGNKYNYVESLTMMVYIIGTIIFLQFVFALLALLYYLLTGAPVNLQYSDVFKAGYFIWATYSLTKANKRNYQFIRLVLLLICIVGTFTLWRLFGVPFLVEKFLH